MDSLVAAGWVKVPPGFKLVPVSPTPQQLFAGVEVTGSLADRYRAMIGAAPDVYDPSVLGEVKRGGEKPNRRARRKSA